MKRKSTFVAALVMLWILAGANSTWGAAGDLLWEKNINFLPDYDLIIPVGVAVSPTTCIIYGIVLHSAYSVQTMAFIKAVNIQTGVLKWERTLSLGANNNYYDIQVYRNVVYIKSHSSSSTGSPPNVVYTFNQNTIGAYAIDTGQTLWEKTNESIYNLKGVHPSVTQTDNQIILFGTGTLNGSNNSAYCIVSCYSTGGQGEASPAINSLLLEQ